MPVSRRTYDAVIAAPIGGLGLRLRDGFLVELDFLGARATKVTPRTAAARTATAALTRYFADPQRPLAIPIDLAGTDFQRRVWRALRRIRPGAVRCYGDIAKELGSSARAVGNACRANPIPIVVPCHRVVAVAGLGGFMGQRTGRAMRLKHWLLEHERRR